ncbi:S41 family peptidase [soil metagenome]
MKRVYLATLLVALSLVAVYAQRQGDYSEEFLNTPAGRAFIQTYGALKSNYLNDVQDDTIIEGAINGMIEALDDPFTYYADPKATTRRNEDMSGSFEGIGAVLQIRNRQTSKGVEILNVYRDGPAYTAGVKKGDIFLEVDGQDVSEFNPAEVADVVRGPKGTVVNIEMLRPGVEEPVTFSIERGTIDIVSVETAVLPNGVGYLSLSTFANQQLYDQMLAQLENLQAQGITSLILDLRDNGGGLLNQGILVADEFLNEGDIVFQRARGVTQRIAAADPAWFDLPMVVLVNRNSASASEIVAGALQENGRALVIGEDTFGKGVAQNVISLSDGGQLAYVSFEWLTPERNSIADKGITPDIIAEDTRTPNVISLEGQGAAPGQELQVVVDGEVVGTATANEDGNFDFVSTGRTRDYSEVQGEALVDLSTDSALKVAYDILLNEVAATPSN